MKFNTKPKGTKTINRAGGKAYEQSNELKFVSLLLTSFLKDQYYRNGAEAQDELVSLVGSIDPYFAAQAAVYARKVFGMRSVSHVVAGEIAKQVKGQTWTKDFFRQVADRADDVLEVLGYLGIEKPIPNSVKKGFKKFLEAQSLYSLTKYRKSNASISMHDAINLLHPFSPAIDEFMKGAKNKETWESKITASGGDSEKKKESWNELLESDSLGYLALIRNVRNLVENGCDMDLLAKRLENEEAIIKSKVYPFQILQASEFATNGKLLGAFSRALELSLKNVPVFEGRTLVALDCSGSMRGDPLNKGSIFAAVLAKTNQADLLLFGDRANFAIYNPEDSVMSLANALKSQDFGGTNFGTIFDEILVKTFRPYDRIVILSDNESWQGYKTSAGSLNKYRDLMKAQQANTHVYNFDLAGYGTTQFPEQDVYCLSGFHPEILNIMKLLEEDKDAIISEIKNINFALTWDQKETN